MYNKFVKKVDKNEQTFYNESGDIMERQILHVDVNNAFLSWTAVEMLKNGSKVDIKNTKATLLSAQNVRCVKNALKVRTAKRL